jgi:quinoprotein glucose dehydrogenase
VYADGFDDPAAGIGASVLFHDGALYYTCIPDLWRLEDADGDGRAEHRERLSTGYGVKVAFLGHDLHGLRLGPDGRLWFSIGDRGLHVETPDGVLALPDTGCVLRCEPDGSGLEIVHTGLRNPQDLAFDDFGDLYTGDNNADGGDGARWVAIAEGADSGWRQPYQWLDHRGPWMDEELWVPAFPGQAAYILPPIANVTSGPSGLTAYPGTGLPPRFDGRFLLCDFLGDPGSSGVLSLVVERRGASFALGVTERVLWGLLATDAEFGPDGALYVTDWVEGWNKTGKGRVYRVAAPERANELAVLSTRTLLSGGMTGRDVSELRDLLGHPDRRVRTAAQLELVTRGDDGLAALETAARGEVVRSGREALFARLHGVWGLGVAARHDATRGVRLLGLLRDREPEVRAQALRMAGEAGLSSAAPLVIAALSDPEARVAYRAALAAGRLGLPDAVPGLIALVRRAAERDTYLRHAAIVGLDGCATDAQLSDLVTDVSSDLRRAVAVVWRRRASPALARLLTDSDPLVVLEASRAIHDLPVTAALPVLAALLDAPVVGLSPEGVPDGGPDVVVDALESGPPAFVQPALARRAMSANLLVGDDECASRLSRAARREDLTPAQRAEALGLLADWGAPEPTDRVTGSWRPVEPRDTAVLPALAHELAADMESAPDEVQLEWAHLAGRGGALAEAGRLAEWAADEERALDVRVAALEALDELAAPELQPAIDLALADAEAELRATALDALDRLAPEEALSRLPVVLEAGELPERRTALEILGRTQAPGAADLLTAELERLVADLFPVELALDLVLAAEAREDETLNALLARHRAPRDADAALTPWLDGLFGGDAEAGEEVFERPSLSCQRCHATYDGGPRRVGPDLRRVGRRLARLQLLESIVDPNRRTAPGFGGSTVFLVDGDSLSGRVLETTDTLVVLQDADGIVHELPHGRIELLREGLSAMPEGLADALTREEMRDLIEYLARL